MLTRKQHQLLSFIDDYLKRTGCSPSFDEMKTALGLHSKSGIHRLVTALEERGFLRRHRQRARALEVIRQPAQAITDVTRNGGHASATSTFTPWNSKNPLTVPANDRAVDIPLLGRIAAGAPIEALSTAGEMTTVPQDMLGRGDYFALTVSGDSMEGAGIMDSDTVIIRRDVSAENGQIVVALIDDEEVTLKRLRKMGSVIGLEAANPRYETRELPAGRVKIQGVLSSLVRRY